MIFPIPASHRIELSGNHLSIPSAVIPSVFLPLWLCLDLGLCISDRVVYLAELIEANN